MDVIVRKDWLAQVQEAPIDPTRRIVDPHHHFFEETTVYPHYRLEDLQADTAPHRVEQTVYLQCWEGYRKSGPEVLKPVGETEWVNGIAARARQQPGAVQIGGIVGTADLCLGTAVRPVLEAHVAASPLFRGIRHIAAWDPSGLVLSMPELKDGNLYGQAAFRAGFGVLHAMGLSFDAYHYYHQSQHLTALAQAFPEAAIVLNHLGTPLGGFGPYTGRDQEILESWKRGLAELAKCPNVVIKLGGLAMPWTGFGFEKAQQPPSSDDLVRRQAGHYHYAIDTFGPDRCMFESNFPVDKCAVSYTVLWNAFKKMAARYSTAEQDQMLSGTATRFYKLKLKS